MFFKSTTFFEDVAMDVNEIHCSLLQADDEPEIEIKNMRSNDFLVQLFFARQWSK